MPFSNLIAFLLQKTRYLNRCSDNSCRLKRCGYISAYNTPYTWSQLALTYAEELSQHWMNDCKADVLLVYITAFGPERIKKSHIVPIFG